MNYSKFELIFSKARMKKYFDACGNNELKSIELYKLNIQLSQAIYPSISILEVALRNAVDKALKEYFEDDEWLLNERYQPDKITFRKLQKTRSKMIENSHPITHSMLVAELHFGFWIKLFEKNSIKLLKGAPFNAFINRPSLSARKIYEHLNNIRIIRNRIAHHEPICFNSSGKICLLKASQIHHNIQNALQWIDHDLCKWAKKLDYVKPMLNRINIINSN